MESIPHSMESIPHVMESIFKKYGVHPQVHGIHPPFHGFHLKFLESTPHSMDSIWIIPGRVKYSEKAPKNRFQVMVEFMKEKYTEETTKMKEHCETYQKEVYVEFIESMNNCGQTNADLSHKL